MLLTSRRILKVTRRQTRVVSCSFIGSGVVRKSGFLAQSLTSYIIRKSCLISLSLAFHFHNMGPKIVSTVKALVSVIE